MAINWVDRAENANGRVVMTQQELKIPGIRMFGKHHTQKAIPALQKHYHENCFEFTFLSKGSIRFSVDEKCYNLSGGDLFIVNPNEVHDTDAHPMTLHSMFWFQLDVSDPKRFLYLEESVASGLIDRLNALELRVVQLDETEAHAILSQVFLNFCSPSQHQRDMGAFLLVYFLFFVIESARRLRFSLQPDIGRVVNHILDHLDEELTMEQLARIANMSVSSFKQKFKSQMGLPPRAYINADRRRAAGPMLQEGFSVVDTAMELGFSSSNYFAVVFRRHQGCSPREFIRKMDRHSDPV